MEDNSQKQAPQEKSGEINSPPRSAAASCSSPGALSIISVTITSSDEAHSNHECYKKRSLLQK